MNGFTRHACLGLALVLVSTSASEAGVPSGTFIHNTATATYDDVASRHYLATSNEIAVLVAAVGSLIVSPKTPACNPQTDGFAVGATLKRIFTIANTSNVSDAYTIAAATVSAGSITQVAWLDAAGNPTPVGSGGTSPPVQPGDSLRVQLNIATANVSGGTTLAIALTARTTAATANGLQSDTGAQCAIAAAGAAFTGPGSSSVPMNVNGGSLQQAQSGARLHFAAALRNSGTYPALNALFTDDFPPGLAPDVSSIHLGLTAGSTSSATRSTRSAVRADAPQTTRLSIPLGDIPPGATLSVDFDALVGAVPLGTSIVDVATLSADNVPSVQTTPISVFVGSADFIYDGNGGSNAPVPNATLQVVDPAGGAIVGTFASKTDGSYALQLPAPPAGGAQSTVAYDLTIAANGYLNRRLRLTLTPAFSSFYSVDVAATDGQLLAAPGSFALVSGPVHLADVAGFAGNLPLFAKRGIAIDASSDRATAAAGDRVVFTAQLSNQDLRDLGQSTIANLLPPGLAYIPGTARLDGTTAEPVRDGRSLTWSLPKLDGPHTLVYAAVVVPGTASSATLSNRFSLTALAANGARPLAASAAADVVVAAGALADRIVIVGRVHIAGSAKNDGVAGVRIYLEDGESVVTDRDGRFSFAASRAGLHVLRLDEATLPAGVRAFGIRAYDDERSTRRLLHGVFDAGTMHDVHFLVERVT